MTKRGQATDLIHPPRPDRDAVPLTVPIYQSTTFVFENAEEVVAFNEGRSGKYLYSRYDNPTVLAVEQQLAGLEQAERTLLFSSGMAAVAAILMTHAHAGDEVVCSASVYGGTLRLLSEFLPRFGIETRLVSLDELAEPERVLGERTRLLWFESPVNPTLRCVDIKRVASACRARNVISAIDNTFASPINQQPLALGVDLAMQSATKYLNGHSDVTAGTVSGPVTLVGPIESTRRLTGAILDPSAAYVLGRSLKTLSIRVALHNANAQAIAEFLDTQPRVSTVYYPGLASHPDHEIAKRQMSGFGGMVCFDLDGDYERAARVFDRLSVIKRAASLGGTESLASLPVLTSHWGHSEARLREAGITKGMIRLSVGLEDVEDLIADLDAALSDA